MAQPLWKTAWQGFSFGHAARLLGSFLGPQPGIESESPALTAQSPNHWTAREFPDWQFLLRKN